MHRPFVLLGLGAIIGILIAAKWQSSLWIGVIGLLLLWSGGSYLYQKSYGRLFLFLLGVLLAFLRFDHAEQENRSHLSPILLKMERDAFLNVRGVVDSSPLIDGDRLTFDLKVQQIMEERRGKIHPIPEETIRVSIYLNSGTEWHEASRLLRGSSIQGPFQFERPPALRNPGGFDYARFLYHHSIHWIGFTDRWQEMKIVPPTGFPWRTWLDQGRFELAKRIERSYEEPYAGFLRGMLLGERFAVDPELESQFAVLGLSHLLSISGLHVGVLVAGIYFFLTTLGLTREKTAGIILCFLPIYVCLTGAGAPVIRAALMTALVLMTWIFRLSKDLFSFLAVALLIQLAFDPYQLFLVGFQLSYLITAALVVGVAPLVERLPFASEWLSQSIAVALIAQLVSFPLLLYHFSEFSILSFVANLFLVPLTSMSIPLAMGGIWIGFVSESWEWLIGKFVAFLLGFTLQVSQWLFSLSWAHFTWAKPSIWWFLFFVASLFYVWVAWIGDLFYRSFHRLIASSCLFLLIGYAFVAPIWDKGTQITFLDVGQGDAVVLETKRGHVIVIDGGNKASPREEKWRWKRKPIDMGERVVLPFLKSRGIRQIDFWILTHGDRDHIGGVMAVSKRIPVKQVIRSIHPPREGLEEELVRFFQQTGTKVSSVQYGLTNRIEERIYWQFLHPDHQRKLGTKEKGNEDSIVCLLSIEGRKVLLTGDIGQKAEERILADWQLPTIDILKVAHHGSGSATTKRWLEKLSPREAVISVGEKNRYGHPHEEVLERLRAYRVRVWRTDWHGAVTVRFEDGQYEIESMVGLGDR